MIANRANWRYTGELLRTRMAELGVTKEELMVGAGFPNRTIVTSLVTGQARLEPKYAAGVARVLQLHEQQLVLLAAEGFMSADDVEFVRPILPTVEEMEFLDEVRKFARTPRRFQKILRKMMELMRLLKL